MKTFTKIWLSIGLLAIVFGIGLLIIAAGSGFRWRNVSTYSKNESYEGIESLDIQIGYGEIDIVEGDGFHLDAKGLFNDELDAYVSDGTWVIRDDQDNNIDLFGMKFSVRQMVNWNEDFTPQITITVPKGFIAKEFSLNISAGSVKIEAIRAEEGYFKVDAGRLKIDQLQVTKESEYAVGAGQMILKQMEANNISVNCGVGNIIMEGTITGDSNVECGVGQVQINLTGNEEDYSFQIDSGVGNVIINDESYHNIVSRRIKSNKADNNFTLECGIGNITVKFD